MLRWIFAVVAVVAASTAAMAQDSQRIAAVVDPRVEFLSAVARTAGFKEYAQANATSPYSARVDALFAPQRAHPAIALAQAMRAQHGLSYDAVMSLAMHLGPPPELQERIDFATRPPRLDARLEPAATRALLVQLRDLAAQVKWAEFAAREQAFYAEAAARLGAAANKVPLVPWFDRTLGVRQGASYQLIAGLLNGGGNYGAGIVFTDGRPEEIRPIIGCWRWDAQGMPVFSDASGSTITPLVAHELCHSYTNAVVDRHVAALQPVGERLFATCRQQMAQQAYGDWKTLLYETLVRACVVRCMADTVGAEAGAAQAKEEVAHGFAWVPALAEALKRFQADRTQWKTIDDFMPVIVQTLVAEAEVAERAEQAKPKLVSCSPANGAADVPPGAATLRLEFDRPMNTKSHSITGDPAQVPAGLKLRGSENGDRILLFDMRLEPGRSYRFGLNGGQHRNFKAADGTPMDPFIIQFRTAPK